MKKIETFLMFADSEHDANMLYATGLFAPDPFIFIQSGGQPMLVMSDLEIDRAKTTVPHCRIVSLSDWLQKLRKNGNQRPRISDVIAGILRGQKIRRVTVPENFPLGLARELEKLHVSVQPRAGAFFPQREIKSAAEIKKISAALKMAEAGMATAVRALKNSKIGAGRKLIYRGVPLTSEKLRAVIGCAILEAGGVASGTIVAGGVQACDPHERGHGPLRAHETIILDIFPRAQATGYFGDITRTVVRGHASEAIRKLYHTVFAGQKIAFQKIRADARTSDIHAAVQNHFAAQGYQTGKHNGRMQGFFHGTGHGLGLEIHEAPRIGATSTGELKTGQIVTNEPGLYYPEIGGVRLEDDVVVTRTGAKNLTRFEKVLEI